MSLTWKLAQDKAKHTLRTMIVHFWRQRLLADDHHFTFQQFITAVDPHGHWRPNSPGRVLELLRRDNAINYEVVSANYKNRRNSLYRALPTKRGPA